MTAKRKQTPHISPARRARLAKVHIAKKELGLSDDVYRSTLALKFPGKDSAKALTDAELDQLLKHFETKGWKPGRGKRKPGSSYRPTSGRASVRKIYAFWGILYRGGQVDANRPDAWINKQFKAGTAEWLNDGQAHDAIERLKKWIKRVGLGHQIK